LREHARAVVLGPSGSGKTSFLHVLAGLRAPDGGRVIVAGHDLAELTETRRDAFRGRHIGYVLQSLHLVKALSVLDNLRLAAFLAGNSVPDAELRGLLQRVGLEDRTNAPTFELSQGEAQRVAIARALVNRPVLVLADEPTSALDDRNARSVVDLLLAVTADRGAALVVATHDARIVPFFDHRLELGSDR
jgi:putative ABC transport system ATP-binding protein